MADNKTKILNNTYEIIQRLDGGAVGQVFKAQNVYTKEIVAIKQVNIKAFKQNDHLFKLFEQEIQNLKTSKSLNIIKYIGNFDDDNNKYVVVEYVDGQTLKSKLFQQKDNVFSESTTISYLIQLLTGIKDLHKNNILHRDLKLENIMISNEGIIKIIDFGSSRVLKEGFTAETYVGTPLNMAPEVYNGQAYGNKCDIYSLGVILYQMLFGHYPFFANDINTLQMIVKKGHINFNSNNIKISQDMQTLITKMLIYDQDKRISWPEIYNNIIIVNYLQNTMQTNRIEGIRLKKDQEEALTVYTVQAKPKKEEISPNVFSIEEKMYNSYYSQKQNYEIVIYTLQKMAELPENVRNKCLIFILTKLAYTRASQLNEDLQNVYVNYDKINQLKEKVSINLQEIKKIYDLSIQELLQDSSKIRSNNQFWQNIEIEINQLETQSNQFQQNFQYTLQNHKSLIKDHMYSLEQNNETQKKGYYNLYILSFLLSFKIFESISSKIDISKIIEEIEQLEYNQLLSQFKASLEKLSR
ncbi:hypothetical protein ABPG74_006529 [Tetrahymena malaccensis]